MLLLPLGPPSHPRSGELAWLLWGQCGGQPLAGIARVYAQDTNPAAVHCRPRSIVPTMTSRPRVMGYFGSNCPRPCRCLLWMSTLYVGRIPLSRHGARSIVPTPKVILILVMG
ncbi:hypothetical protein K438DRAFT_1811073 [Mycena galopus ATCC 62051]|nr:hypothetical protein K438DRAFT_1811073 [Mycena galopus ATCC 62051]